MQPARPRRGSPQKKPPGKPPSGGVGGSRGEVERTTASGRRSSLLAHNSYGISLASTNAPGGGAAAAAAAAARGAGKGAEQGAFEASGVVLSGWTLVLFRAQRVARTLAGRCGARPREGGTSRWRRQLRGGGAGGGGAGAHGAKSSVRPILRSSRQYKAHYRSAASQRAVRWAAQLVEDAAGDGADADAEAELEQARALQRQQLRERLAAHYKVLRMPCLTLEFFSLPMRVAFPALTAHAPFSLAVDVSLDWFELCRMAADVLAEADLRSAFTAEEREDAGAALYPYTLGRLGPDLLGVLLLHGARATALAGGGYAPWYAAQAVRLLRVFDLYVYVGRVSTDLTTNVLYLAVFKFTIVVIGLPHLLACVWWLVAQQTLPAGEHGVAAVGGYHDGPIAPHTWAGQLYQLTGNPRFDPDTNSDLEKYWAALYMAMGGMTALGYVTVPVSLKELLLMNAVCFCQIVFYAFVLGTLFHYLFRTDEGTARYKDLLRAVDEYARARKLPARLARALHAYFEFQNSKASSAHAHVFGQLPHSLKVRVASAQYRRHIEAAWVFKGAAPQFLNEVVIALKERHVMPNEVLWKQGDGTRELLFCRSGSLHVRAADVHIATIRSDVGESAVVGEFSFFLGIVQPHTVSATGVGDVTLLLLTRGAYDEILDAFPEQAEVVLSNMLRHVALDKAGNDLSAQQQPRGGGGGGAGGAAGGSSPAAGADSSEADDFERLRQTVRDAILRRNEDSLSQMTYAASEGDVETVRTLAQSGLDLDAADYDGRTTLHLAAAEGNVKVVELLCDLGANPTVTDRWGGAPIKDAVSGRHEAVAAALRERGAQLELEQPAAALCNAASAGDVTYIATLLSHGLEINAGDYDRRTALHLAAAEGNVRVVEFLVSRLADVNVKDRWGRTPVDDAMTNSRALVTDLLYDAGSRPSEEASAERLCESAGSGDIGRLRLLVHCGLDVDAGDYDARTALHLAACAGSVSAVDYLISARADVNAKDRWGNTPLVDALQHSYEVAALLLAHGGTLPAAVAASGALDADLAKARALSVYELERQLQVRSVRRKALARESQQAKRAIGVAFESLISDVAKLVGSFEPLCRKLGEAVPRWVQVYAAEDDRAVLGAEDSDDDERDLSGFEEELRHGEQRTQRRSARSDRPSRGSRRSRRSADSTDSPADGAAPAEGGRAHADGLGRAAGAGAVEAAAERATGGRVHPLATPGAGGAALARPPLDGSGGAPAAAMLLQLPGAAPVHGSLSAAPSTLSAGAQQPERQEVAAGAPLDARVPARRRGSVSSLQGRRRGGAAGAAAHASPGVRRRQATALAAAKRRESGQKSFISLILRLPKAADGLEALRAMFSDALDDVPGSPSAQDAALVSLVREAFGADVHTAARVCAEVHDELEQLLGRDAPRRGRVPGGDGGGSGGAAAADGALVLGAPMRPRGLSAAALEETTAAAGARGGSELQPSPSRRARLSSQRFASAQYSGDEPAGAGAGMEASLLAICARREATRRSSVERPHRGSVEAGADGRRRGSVPGVGAPGRSGSPSTAASEARRADESDDDAEYDAAHHTTLADVGWQVLLTSPTFVEHLAALGSAAAKAEREGARRAAAAEPAAPAGAAHGRARALAPGGPPADGEGSASASASLASTPLEPSKQTSFDEQPPPHPGHRNSGGGERALNRLMGALTPASVQRLSSRAPGRDSSGRYSAYSSKDSTPDWGPSHMPPERWRRLCNGTETSRSKESSEGGSKEDASGRGALLGVPSPVASARTGSPVAARFVNRLSAAAAPRASRAAAPASMPEQPPPLTAAERRRDLICSAVGLIRELFGVLDVRQRGAIAAADMRDLHGVAGELGAKEIRALLGYLTEASITLGGADEDGSSEDEDEDAEEGEGGSSTGMGYAARPRRARRAGSRSGQPLIITRTQFYVGTASWIIAEREAEATAGGGAPGGGGARRGSGSMLALHLPPRRGSLRAGDLANADAAADGRGSVGSGSAGAPHGFIFHALSLGGGRGGGSDNGAAAAAMSATLCVQLADAIAARWARDPSAKSERADAAALAATLSNLQQHSGTQERRSFGAEQRRGSGARLSAADAAQWASAALGLELRDAGSGGADATAVSWGRLERAVRAHADELAASADASARSGLGRVQWRARRALSGARAAARAGGARGLLAHAASVLGGAPGGARGAARRGGASERPWHVLPHTSATYRRLRAAVLCATLWNALMVPVKLCFFAEVSRLAWWPAVEIACDLLYLLKMAVGFNTSYVNAKSVTVYSARKVRKHYLATDFLVDLIAAMPQDHFLAALGAQPYAVACTRLLRLVAARDLLHAYARWCRSITSDSLLLGLATKMVVYVACAHVGTCVWNLLGHPIALEGRSVPARLDDPAHRWPAAYYAHVEAVGGVPLPDSASSGASALLEQYLTSLYFEQSVITTLGLVQPPSNHAEVVTIIVFLLANLTVYAWAVGEISNLVMKQDDEIVSKRGQRTQVQAYLAHSRVPLELRAEIDAFFAARLEDKSSLSHVSDEEIYNALPLSLQIEICRYTNRALLEEVPLVAGCAEAFLDRCSSMLREQALEPETLLFRTNDVSKQLFVVAAGAVEVFDTLEEGGTEVVKWCTAGNTAGELSFVFKLRHHNSAKVSADGEAKVYALSQEDYRLLLKLFPEQEDAVMTNCVDLYDTSGAFSARSGVSGVSRGQSSTGLSSGDVASEAVSRKSHEQQDAMSRITSTIADAKEQRRNSHVVKLCDAAHKGDVSAIQRIAASAKLDLNNGDYDKRRPIHLAASEGHVPAIELLIALNADVNVRDRYDGTPLADALRHKRLDAARLLYARGAELGIADVAERLCSAAASAEGAEQIRHLLEFQCEPSAADYDSRTALHLAAAEGHADNVRLLLEAKADVNAQDRWGHTPLQESFTHERDECSELLLGAGGEMGRFDVAGAFCAAAAANDVVALQKLVRHQLAVNSADYDARTALHLAASNGRLAATDYLLHLPDIEVNAQDRYRYTPLDDATRHGHAVVRMLIETAGGVRGDHVDDGSSFVHEIVRDDEDERQAAQAGKVADQARMLAAIESMREWIRAEAHSARRMRKRLDQMLKLEAEQGEVISDVQPRFWAELKDYARAHQGRYLKCKTEIQLTLVQWEADLETYAYTSVYDMEQSFKRLQVPLLVQLQEGVRSTFEWVLDTTFASELQQANAQQNRTIALPEQQGGAEPELEAERGAEARRGSVPVPGPSLEMLLLTGGARAQQARSAALEPHDWAAAPEPSSAAPATEGEGEDGSHAAADGADEPDVSGRRERVGAPDEYADDGAPGAAEHTE